MSGRSFIRDHLRGEGTDMLVRYPPLAIDHEGFGHAVHTPIDTDPTVQVSASRTARAIPLHQRIGKRRRRLVLFMRVPERETA